MTVVHVRHPVRPAVQRIRVERSGDWERVGRAHFLNRRAYDAARPPWIRTLRTGLQRLFRRR